MGRVDREQRASTVARLEALRAEGVLTTAHVRLAASGLGVVERTVWRWLRGATAGPGTGSGIQPDAGPDTRMYRLSEADRAGFAHYRGNIAAVHRARAAVVSGREQAAGVPVPRSLVAGWAGARPVTLRSLQRAFRRELTPAERAAWTEGEHGRRSAQVYLTRPPTPRNQVWEADHKDLPILVLPPRGPAVRPWLTSVIDDGTRALVGWALSLVPHSGTVLTALRMALVHDEARGPFGGIPAQVRIDRGLDFAAGVIRDALAALVIDPHRLPGFTPHRKGKVERIHLTIEQTLLCGLPGYTHGPRDAAGELYGPISDSPAARAAAAQAAQAVGAAAAGGGMVAGGPMRIERFAALFASWVGWYNAERPHSMLDGLTPLRAWDADPSAVRRVSPERVRHLLLADAQRRIGKDGIRFNGLRYLAPELQGRVGQLVQARHMPHDDRFVEVYLDGAHLCTAYPSGQLREEQVEAFREHARAEARRLGAARRRASRRAREELVPLTGAETTAEAARLVPAEQAGGLSRRRRDELLRSRSAADLLGLTDPLTPAGSVTPVELDDPDAEQER